jgi:DnaK suppressor protein
MPTKKSAVKSASKPAKLSKTVAPSRKVVARVVAHKTPPKSAPKATAKPAPVKAVSHKPAPAVKAIPKTVPAKPQIIPAAEPAPVKKTPPRMPIPGKPTLEKNVAVATASRAARPAPEVVDGEDLDGDMNLLAGPRNVTPYIAQRGEQYMSKEQLEHFRQILGTWKTDLMREVDRTVSHMKDEAANFPDPNDRATQEEEFSLELRTRDRERKLIRKIDEALQRIEDGSYGYCLETGEEIGIKRLEARPVATLSLEAQERRERREKQYGDRDDRYR